MTHPATTTPSLQLGFDVGGTSIKYALIDTASGKLHGPLQQVATPQPATPQDIAAAIRRITLTTPEILPQDVIGVALPSVVSHGTTRTAANIDASWQDFEAANYLSAQTEQHTVLINDADAAGLAETAFGAGRNQPGITLMVTLGTGIGSAVFIDGVLLPNTELGHLQIQDTVAEHWASAVARERHDIPWAEYAQRLQTYLSHVERLFSPDLIIIGGGISAVSSKYLPELRLHARVTPAKMGNAAGAIGAAVAASTHPSTTTTRREGEERTGNTRTVAAT